MERSLVLVLAIQLILVLESSIAFITSEQQMFFVEVQTGSYFGEDDIERVEDDFGR